MLRTISIKVSGRVQGVFYRQSAKEKALSLGISGHVRNMPDGTVLIIATADEELLTLFVQWCSDGPARAMVTNVETSVAALQQFEGFQIIR